MRGKYFCIIEDEDLLHIKDQLTLTLGLPELTKKFSIYAFNNAGDEIHIDFKGKSKYITYLSHEDDQTLIKHSKFVFNNLKAFIKLINKMGFTECSTGEVIEEVFNTNDVHITISNNTFIGNLLTVSTKSKIQMKKLEELIGTKYKFQDRGKISQYTKSLDIPRVPLINKFNVIDESIVRYADSVGLDIRSLENTLQSKIESFSNDYSFYEKPYKEITKSNLLSNEPNQRELSYPIPSIIIPSYNSEETILQTLYSIESQNLPATLIKNIDVAVIDDGSKIPVTNIIDKHFKNFTFSINLIRLSKNRGLSTARNIGINATRNEHLVFLDSDIILSKNYIKEHMIRSTLIPNGIFVSFKKNIKKSDSLTNIDIIKEGIEAPLCYDDLRVNRLIEGGKPGIVNASETTYTEILADTNYFKNLGYGRRIGIFDLPSMVIGHNFSARRKVVQEIGSFSDNFQGWGLEDSYFGARAIAHGNFIIPVMSSGVYHIDHAPRSGSESKKQNELLKNLKIYKELVRSESW